MVDPNQVMIMVDDDRFWLVKPLVHRSHRVRNTRHIKGQVTTKTENRGGERRFVLNNQSYFVISTYRLHLDLVEMDQAERRGESVSHFSIEFCAAAKEENSL